jgi:hypothetical protein
MRHAALSRAEEGLVCMCEERARMLQDQFAVSVNHVHALAILVATFNYEKQPPALDQVRDLLLLQSPHPPISMCVYGRFFRELLLPQSVSTAALFLVSCSDSLRT